MQKKRTKKNPMRFNKKLLSNQNHEKYLQKRCEKNSVICQPPWVITKEDVWDILAFIRRYQRQKLKGTIWYLTDLLQDLPVPWRVWGTSSQQYQDNLLNDIWLYLSDRDFRKEINSAVLIISQPRGIRRILKVSKKSTAYRYMASRNF